MTSDPQITLNDVKVLTQELIESNTIGQELIVSLQETLEPLEVSRNITTYMLRLAKWCSENPTSADVPIAELCAKSRPGRTSMVYKYGTPSWATLPDSVMQQMRMGHILRNRMVEIQREEDADCRKIELDFPEICALNEEIGRVRDSITELDEHISQQKIVDRSPVVDKDLKGKLTAAKKELAALKVYLKANKKSNDALQSELRIRRSSTASSLLDARKLAVEDGLFWATATDVLNDHKTSIKNLIGKRSKGAPAELRFKRWEGEGYISVQLQRGSTCETERSPEVLASEKSPWRNVLALVPTDYVGKKRYVLKLRVSSTEHVELPIILHRTLPVDSEVVAAQLIRKKVGTKFRIDVCLSINTISPLAASYGEDVVLRTQWTTVGHRVLMGVLSAGDKIVPEHLTGHIESLGGGLYNLYSHPRWNINAGRCASIDSIRQENYNSILLAVQSFVKTDRVLISLIKSLDIRVQDITKWRSPGRLVTLQRSLAKSSTLWAMIEDWRLRDKHLWDFSANEKAQVAGERKDLYRKMANWALTGSSTLTLNKVSVADSKQVTESDSVGEDRSKQHVRKNLQSNSPALLRDVFKQKAKSLASTIYEDSL